MMNRLVQIMLPRVGSRRQGEKELDVPVIRAWRAICERSQRLDIGRVSALADEADDILYGIHGLFRDDACTVCAIDQDRIHIGGIL